MELLNVTVPSNFDVALLGDNHKGSKLEYTKALDSCLDWVMSEHDRYYIHMGDALEAITVDDKRYQMETQTVPIPLIQARSVIWQFAKTSTRCLGWLLGNHELKLWRFGNLVQDIICDGMGVNYGGFSCAITFNDNYGKMFKGHFRHGIGTALASNAKDEEQRIANMKATLKMRLKRKAGDCIIMATGCTHKLLVVPPVKTLYLTDDGETLHQHYLQANQLEEFIHPDMRWYVNTGTFRKSLGIGFTDYAELKGYDPITIGHAVMEVRDRKVVNVREVEF